MVQTQILNTSKVVYTNNKISQQNKDNNLISVSFKTFEATFIDHGNSFFFF